MEQSLTETQKQELKALINEGLNEFEKKHEDVFIFVKKLMNNPEFLERLKEPQKKVRNNGHGPDKKEVKKEVKKEPKSVRVEKSAPRERPKTAIGANKKMVTPSKKTIDSKGKTESKEEEKKHVTRPKEIKKMQETKKESKKTPVKGIKKVAKKTQDTKGVKAVNGKGDTAVKAEGAEEKKVEEVKVAPQEDKKMEIQSETQMIPPPTTISVPPQTESKLEPEPFAFPQTEVPQTTVPQSTVPQSAVPTETKESQLGSEKIEYQNAISVVFQPPKEENPTSQVASDAASAQFAAGQENPEPKSESEAPTTFL